MSGSKGGGTSTTTSTPLTKEQYDPYGYAYRKLLFPKLYDKYDQGLSDEEKSYYRGQGLGEVEKAYSASEKGLRENLARTGIGPGDGASAESIADLLRQKLIGRAGVGTDLIGKDIGTKQQNLVNLMNLISDSGMVGTSGSTTKQEANQGSTVGNVIKGSLGGALGGWGLGSSIGSIGGPWGALGGAVLGGLGGLF